MGGGGASEIQSFSTSFCSLLFVQLSVNQVALGFAKDKYDVVADAALLAAVAEQDKGRKLLARVFKLLPSQAPAMLPTVLRVLLTARSKEAQQQQQLDRFTLANRREADNALFAAALAVVTAPPASDGRPRFPYLAARACVESVMAPHIKVGPLGFPSSLSRPRDSP